MTFFDTNVLIAASVPTHIHHVACNRRLSILKDQGAACAAHSLAEAYSILTRLSRYAVPPESVAAILREAADAFTLVALTPREMLRTLQELATEGRRGPIVYDGLILSCARKINATRIYTNDVADFRSLAPDLATRIVEP